MEELMKAVALVLEWHDENLSDGVNREYAIRELRQAYEAAQQSVQADGITICQNCGSWLRAGECENCNSPIAPSRR